MSGAVCFDDFTCLFLKAEIVWQSKLGLDTGVCNPGLWTNLNELKQLELDDL